MNISCMLGLHKWDGCECLKCGRTRPDDNCSKAFSGKVQRIPDEPIAVEASWDDLYGPENGTWERQGIVVKMIRCNGKDIRAAGKYKVHNGRAKVRSKLLGDFVIEFRRGGNEYHFTEKQRIKLHSLQ
jgi:hypothetical protein